VKTIRYILLNGVFLAFFYFGFVEYVEGARNAAFFMAWISIVLSLFCLSKKFTESLKEGERPVPGWVRMSFELAVSVAFAWYGAWVTASFYFLHALLIEAAWLQAEKS